MTIASPDKGFVADQKEYLRQWYQLARKNPEWLAERKRKVNAQRRGKGYGRKKHETSLS